MRRTVLGLCTIPVAATIVLLLLPEPGEQAQPPEAQRFEDADEEVERFYDVPGKDAHDVHADDADEVEHDPALSAVPERPADRLVTAQPPHEGQPRPPLPKTRDGKIDFAALGLTGKESGAELLRTEETVREAPVRFVWSPGDTWEVETFYRQMQAGDGDVWSGPTRWQFRVDREEFVGMTPALLVEVTLLDVNGRHDASFPATTFTVSADGKLLHADLYHVRAGKGKMTRVAYRAEDGPITASGSIVPFDLPPNGVVGTLVGARGLPTLDPVTPGSRRQFPQPAELLGAGQDRIEVRYRSPVDGTKVRQEWSTEDMRWPVISETEHRRSYRRR